VPVYVIETEDSWENFLAFHVRAGLAYSLLDKSEIGDDGGRNDRNDYRLGLAGGLVRMAESHRRARKRSPSGPQAA
jgi:hypothetical protein